VRRAEGARDPARCVDDQLHGALELLADLARPPKVHFLVPKGVVPDFVSRRGDPAGDRRNRRTCSPTRKNAAGTSERQGSRIGCVRQGGPSSKVR